MLRIFIGHDSDEVVAANVLAHSIERHAKQPVSITKLILRQLPLTRPREVNQSTEFSFSRFLVPWLCNYRGTALYLDCDMLCRSDIAELFSQMTGAVSVVRHNYTPKDGPKFLDRPQTRYARKNWSSAMLFNCAWCPQLTPEYVNTASGLDLHQFKWTSDALVGSLDQAWNHLVGEFAPNPEAKLAHFTRGTPCFERYAHCEFADEWYAERAMMLEYKVERTADLRRERHSALPEGKALHLAG